MDKDNNRTIARIHELLERFRDLHSAGMAALERHDFDALNEAIQAERTIIEEQVQLVALVRTDVRSQ